MELCVFSTVYRSISSNLHLFQVHNGKLDVTMFYFPWAYEWDYFSFSHQEIEFDQFLCGNISIIALNCDREQDNSMTFLFVSFFFILLFFCCCHFKYVCMNLVGANSIYIHFWCRRKDKNKINHQKSENRDKTAYEFEWIIPRFNLNFTTRFFFSLSSNTFNANYTLARVVYDNVNSIIFGWQRLNEIVRHCCRKISRWWIIIGMIK